MVETKPPHSLGELEQHFDEALSRLGVFELPLTIALHASLRAFEESHCTAISRIPERFSALAAMLHYKCALEILIPELFKRCSPEEPLEERPILAGNVVDTVTDALHFCERYHFVVHSYTLYHQQQFTGSLSGRVVDFQYSEGIDLGRSSLNLLLSNYHEQRTVDQSRLSGMLPPLIPTDNSRTALVNRIKSTHVKTILDSTPDELYIPIRQMTEAALPRPAVDPNASCGSYSIGDCYKFWVEFMVRMLAYRQACEEMSRIDDSFDLWQHRILQLTLPELSTTLANRGTVEYEVALSILSDLVFDSGSSRPDILVQPLVPISTTETVLIAPSLIYTTNWEVCVLRNWIRRYPNMYGRVIASKKGELAKSLGSALASKSFVTSANRKLTDRRGQPISDVDVAAFDPSDGLLAILQVKWLVEPDSIRETLRTEAEISYAIEQSIRCKREFENDRSRFLKQVFPNDNVGVSAVNELKCYVIARGDMGNKDDAENDIYVLDYVLSVDAIADSGNASLRQILARIVDKQVEISKSIEERSHPIRVKLAGYLMRIPGYGAAARPIVKRKPRADQRRRNAPCICGSGRKYKKCCLELANYDEEVA